MHSVMEFTQLAFELLFYVNLGTNIYSSRMRLIWLFALIGTFCKTPSKSLLHFIAPKSAPRLIELLSHKLLRW